MDEAGTNEKPEGDVARAGELDATMSDFRGRGPDFVFRLLIVLLMVRLVWPMAQPLLLGAFATIVLFRVNERWTLRLGKAGALAPALVTGSAVLCVLVPITWVMLRILRAARGFVGGLGIADGGATRERLIEVLDDVFRGTFSHEEIASYLGVAAGKAGAVVGRLAAELATAMPDVITNGFLFMLTLYFGLRDGTSFIAWAKRVSPVSPQRTAQLFTAIARATHGTLVGMLVVAFVQGGIATLAFISLRVEHAILWGFVASLCSTIPIVGTTPVTLGASVYLYLQGRPLAALTMIGIALVIGLSDNVVRPWVQSQHDDMHPLIALLAIFGGLAVFGPTGLILGPVIASMALWAIESRATSTRAEAE